MFAIRTRHTEHGYAENEPSEEQKKREKRRGEGPLGQGRGREEERGWRRAGEEDAVRGQRRRRLRHRRRVGQGPRRRLPLVQPSLSRISPAPVTRDTRVLFPASNPAQRRLWLLLPPSGLPPLFPPPTSSMAASTAFAGKWESLPTPLTPWMYVALLPRPCGPT